MMNKRQRKKRYKKIYGVNPPSKELTTVLENLSKAAEDVFAFVKDMVSTVLKTMSDTVTMIRTLPDNEFEELMEAYTPEQQDAARKIRGCDDAHEEKNQED